MIVQLEAQAAACPAISARGVLGHEVRSSTGLVCPQELCHSLVMGQIGQLKGGQAALRR